MENKKTTAQTNSSSAKNAQNNGAYKAKTAQNNQANQANKSSQTNQTSQKSSTTQKTGHKTSNCAAQTSYKAECAEDICKLSDKDIISDVLGSQKALITLYSTALCESSCKNMRNVVTTKLAECAEDQFDMFLYMNQRGMYPTENATAQKLNQAKTLYASQKSKMK